VSGAVVPLDRPVGSADAEDAGLSGYRFAPQTEPHRLGLPVPTVPDGLADAVLDRFDTVGGMNGLVALRPSAVAGPGPLTREAS
jgi:hypothetical protein